MKHYRRLTRHIKLDKVLHTVITENRGILQILRMFQRLKP